MSYKRIKNIPLMETYKEIHGNLFIPPQFIIPKSGDWPISQSEFNLGQYVNHIRQQLKKNSEYYDPQDVQHLIDMGFVWNVSNYKSEIVLLAARTYHKLFGTLDVKYKFTVPKGDDQWDPITWGLKLQTTLQNIKNVGIHNTIHHELALLGFNVERDPFHSSLPAVESTGQLPDATAGSSKREIEHVEQQFEDDDSKVVSDSKPKRKKSTESAHEVVLRVIEHIPEMVIYKQIYGDLLIPQKYVIGERDSGWPEEFIGVALGEYVFKLRLSVKKSRRLYNASEVQRLTDMGFIWDLSQNKTDSVMLALQTYLKIHQNLDVMYKFVVPVGDPTWPKSTWGIKLGTVLNNIKYNASYAHKRDELMAMGVDFKVGHNLGPSPNGEINPNTLGAIKRQRVAMAQNGRSYNNGGMSGNSSTNSSSDALAAMNRVKTVDNSDSEDDDEENNTLIVQQQQQPGRVLSTQPLIGHTTQHRCNDQQFVMTMMPSLQAPSQWGGSSSATTGSNLNSYVQNTLQEQQHKQQLAMSVVGTETVAAGGMTAVAETKSRGRNIKKRRMYDV